MRKLISKVVPLLVIPLFLVADYAFANSGNTRVLAMLKKNSIVNAAVAEAKRFSGAKTCQYNVESSEPPQFQKGTTFDYSAEITCSHNEAAGIIRVKGRMFSEEPQELTISIAFAG